MKMNEDLQKNVQDAIKWEPLLNAAEIGVTAKDGIVTLTGIVNSYAKKKEAENATKNVIGVKAVVEKIEIKFDSSGKLDDNDIAIEAVKALNWNWEIPNEEVKVQVENGWVILEGEIQWNYQREAAKKTIETISGVTGVTNLLTIKAESEGEIEIKGIENAIARNWSLDERDIDINVNARNVTISGKVNSLFQKEEVERLVWNSPGVCTVNNELEIDYD